MKKNEKKICIQIQALMRSHAIISVRGFFFSGDVYRIDFPDSLKMSDYDNLQLYSDC